MTDRLLLYLMALSALGCGLNGGVFFAFSTFVMNGLARLTAPLGAAAMNSINVTAVNPLFMLSLFGTAVLVLATAIVAVKGHDLRTPWIVSAALLYLGGAILVTIICNVPRNNALIAIDFSDPRIVSVWSDYLRSWTGWNHVRTVTSLLASACLIAALCIRRLA